MNLKTTTLILTSILFGSISSTYAQSRSRIPARAWFPVAPPLPPPSGEVIDVASVEGLLKAAERVRPGGTIRLADGHYMMPQYFELRADRVTLRGASGNRSRVVIDGAKSRHHELVGITNCSGVTIADLTIQNVVWNGFKLNSDVGRGVHQATIRNCVIRNVWQRGVKAVRTPTLKSRGCVVEYCLFYNDRRKELTDDPHDTAKTFGGNYVGGIDAMDAVGWKVRDNVFIGIQGKTLEGPGAIFFWHDSVDCLIERNMILGCDVGIGIGNAFKPDDVKIHCSDFVVRNNFITRPAEQAVSLVHTRNCKVLHNTIYDPKNRYGRSIRIVLANENLRVENNLILGFPPKVESRDNVLMQGNVVQNQDKDWFVTPAEGNLRLKQAVPGVVDRGRLLVEVTEDIDRQQRGEKPDIGADEWVEPTTNH